MLSELLFLIRGCAGTENENRIRTEAGGRGGGCLGARIPAKEIGNQTNYSNSSIERPLNERPTWNKRMARMGYGLRRRFLLYICCLGGDNSVGKVREGGGSKIHRVFSPFCVSVTLLKWNILLISVSFGLCDSDHTSCRRVGVRWGRFINLNQSWGRFQKLLVCLLFFSFRTVQNTFKREIQLLVAHIFCKMICKSYTSSLIEENKTRTRGSFKTS